MNREDYPLKTYPLILYTEMSALFISTSVIGISLSLHQWWYIYEILPLFFYIACAYILVFVAKVSYNFLHYSSDKVKGYSFYELGNPFARSRLLTNKFLILTLLLSTVLGVYSYYHSKSILVDYYSINRFFMGQEGDYLLALTKDSITIKENQQRLEGKFYFLSTSKKNQPLLLPGNGQIQAYVDNVEKLTAGSLVFIHGKASPIKHIEEPNHIFTEGRKISSSLIGYIYNGQVTKIDESVLANYSYKESIIEKIIRYYYGASSFLRLKICQHIEMNLPISEAYLCEGLLLGGNYSELDPKITKTFSFTGLIHILSVSGSHIALLFTFVYGLLHIMGIQKRKAAYVAIFTIFLYCLLLGFNAPAIRASIMGLITAIALIKGRTYSARQGLMNTALILLLYDPMLLVDVSFQLSCLSTLGIITFVKSFYYWMPAWPALIKGPLVVCGMAQISILPLQIYYFHFLSPFSFLAAIVVAPLLEILILLILLVLLLSYLIPCGWAWFLVSILIKATLFLNYTLALGKGSAFWVAPLSLGFSCLYYGLLRGFYYYLNEAWPIQPYKRLICFIGLILLFVVHFYVSNYDSHLKIHTMPMGQKIMQVISQGSKNRLLIFIGDNKPLEDYEKNRIIDSLHSQGSSFFTCIYVSQIKKEDLEFLSSYLKNNNFAYNKSASNYLFLGNWESYKGSSCHLLDSDNSHGIQLSSKWGYYSFYHGQNIEKILQLNNTKEVIVSNSSKIFNSIDFLNLKDLKNIVIYPSISGYGDIDPANSNIYIVGHRSIPDFCI